MALEHKLSLFDRKPFTELLTLWLAIRPDDKTLQEFAMRSPEKWISAMQIIAKLAGFTEKTESAAGDSLTDIAQMSDSQLEDKLKELLGTLSKRSPEFNTSENDRR
jgi:hypothetical protein